MVGIPVDMVREGNVNIDDRDIAQFLMEKGIKPSVHRIKIYKYLVEKHNHPTVDIIYNELSESFPTLSKTTIYNTLYLFARKKIVITLTIEDGELRFDINTKPHIHFKCVRCGRIYDVYLECEIFKRKEIEGHKINEYRLYLSGVCSECRKSDGV
jgi:Fe2+ or Zn2+ uptake regulation protein